MNAETAVKVLNEMFDLDPVATSQLFSHRVPCNQGVVDHPSITVRKVDDGWRVGVLGVLNGILSREDPKGAGVGVCVDAHEKIYGFRVVKITFDAPNSGV